MSQPNPASKPNVTTKALLTAALLLTAATAAAAYNPTALTPAQASFGDWRSAIGAIVRIEPCSTDSSVSGEPDICLRVVKLSPNPPEIVDSHNPDHALRNRQLCGLTIGSGFRDYDKYRLGYGHLYDPISGHTYRGYITPTGHDVLKLRGYVLFTLFGRTETWTRVPPVQACK
ncbi:DUF2147 domain-containing protein [Granulicella sp. 5B5]|uniref:DUF2147 domain-containing protein n=1 Tax=Granulicella sp. 5B5 TaxID=1617967 RepID=UPI0015F4183D|nr:DUF2147 domain-containing protein [Granulicella sp. 5B5]